MNGCKNKSMKEIETSFENIYKKID